MSGTDRPGPNRVSPRSVRPTTIGGMTPHSDPWWRDPLGAATIAYIVIAGLVVLADLLVEHEIDASLLALLAPFAALIPALVLRANAPRNGNGNGSSSSSSTDRAKRP
jgi:hypothetical protein